LFQLAFILLFQTEIDLFYSLIVYLQALCLLHYFQKEDYLKLLLYSYALAGIGFLTKGLPLLAFQSITILALFIYYKRFKALFSVWNFAGIVLMLIIIGGYFYLYSFQHDPWSMITRIISESTNRSAVNRSWSEVYGYLYSFPQLLLTITAPWIILVPIPQLKQAWKAAIQNE